MIFTSVPLFIGYSVSETPTLYLMPKPQFCFVFLSQPVGKMGRVYIVGGEIFVLSRALTRKQNWG